MSMASPSRVRVLHVSVGLDFDKAAGRRIYTDHELIIGRDKTRCQYVIDEPVVSNKHIRIYTVVYEQDKPTEIPPLVYAEDLSRNGTYWNGSLIGKGNGGFLLSDGDTLRVSAKTCFYFQRSTEDVDDEMFDLVQEKELRRFQKDYIVTDRLIGSGAFGRVFMAIEQNTRTQLACKVVDLRKLKPQSRVRISRLEQPAAAEDGDSRIQLRKVKEWVEQQKRENQLEDKLKIYYREAEILASINHPNIIGLEKVFLTDNTMYMFLDLVTAGDLFSYIEHKNGKLLEVEAAVIIRQVVIALVFLHRKNIIHRDLKPDNILMTSLAAGARVVLTDFGTAKTISAGQQRMSTLVGTIGYTAPEVLGRSSVQAPDKGYTRAVDMWSLGCLTVLLLTGGLAFIDPKTKGYSEKLADECNLASLKNSPEWEQIRSRPKEFVKKLLILDEAERLSAQEALEHPWFSNELHKTDFEELYQRTIRHWRPRILKQPVIEFADAEKIRRLPCSQVILDTIKKPRRRGQMPVEPPYIPFPRNMHEPLLPKRVASARVSDEVKAAIRENWTFTRHSSGSDRRSLPHFIPPSAHLIQQLRTSRIGTVESFQSESSDRLAQPPKTQRRRMLKPLSTRIHSEPTDEMQRNLLTKEQGHPFESMERPEASPKTSQIGRAFSPSARDSNIGSHTNPGSGKTQRDEPQSAQVIAKNSTTRATSYRPHLKSHDIQFKLKQGIREQSIVHVDEQNVSESHFERGYQSAPITSGHQEATCDHSKGLQEAETVTEILKHKLQTPSVVSSNRSSSIVSKKRRRGSIFDIVDEGQMSESYGLGKGRKRHKLDP